MTQKERIKIHKEEEKKWLAIFVKDNLDSFNGVSITDDEFDLLVENLYEAFNANEEIASIIDDLAFEVVKDFIIND